MLKTNTCRFSGLRIYPGKGLIFIRTDGQQYMFLNKKCKAYYHNRLRPAKLAWTVAYRKQHKKDQVQCVYVDGYAPRAVHVRSPPRASGGAIRRETCLTTYVFSMFFGVHALDAVVYPLTYQTLWPRPTCTSASSLQRFMMHCSGGSTQCINKEHSIPK